MTVTVTDKYGKTAEQNFSIQLLQREEVGNVQVLALSISGGLLVIGGPLVGLAVLKMCKARKAWNSNAGNNPNAVRRPAPRNPAPSS